MKRDRTIAFVIVVLVLALVSQAAVQTGQPKTDQSTLKLTADLVQIDVLVTDKNNKPVAGLKREDFQLYDNNKLQYLTAFAYEESKARQFSGDTGASRRLPRAITAGEVKRVIAFVIDTLHMNFSSVYASQRMLTDFIDHKMEPGDLVLIFPTGGGSGVLQQFTADQRVLRRAVSRLRPIVFTGASTAYRSSPTPTAGGLFGPRPVGPGQGGGLMTQGAPWPHGDPIEEADARATIRTLGNLAKYMSSLPGRKIGIVVSEGFRIFQTELTGTLNEMTALAARANVVLYTIDPRGLDPLMLTAADAVEQGGGLGDAIAMANRKRDDFNESQESLNAIALDTGGKFFRNNNDIMKGLGNFLQENSAYYLLGFQPEASKWDGKLHRIKVAVLNRPDLNVSFRRSYLAKTFKPDPPTSLDPKVAEVNEALSSPMVRRDIDLRLTPFYLDDPKQEIVVTSVVHIDVSRFSFKEVDGKYKASFEQIGFIFNALGKPVDKFAQTIVLNLLPQKYEQAMKRGIVFTRALSVRPGAYQVNMFVREPVSGLIGTASDFFEIPEIKGTRLAVSSIFTDARAIKDGKVIETGGEGGTLAQRRFSRNGEFMYRLVVYNAKADSKTGKPQLEIRARVLSGGNAVFTGNFRPLEIEDGSTLPSRILTGGILNLGDLAPAEYTLELTVKDTLRKRDKNSIIRQEIDFTVE